MATLNKKTLALAAIVGAFSAFSGNAYSADTVDKMGGVLQNTPAAAAPTPVNASAKTKGKKKKTEAKPAPAQAAPEVKTISEVTGKKKKTENHSVSTNTFNSHGWYLGGGANVSGNGGELIYGQTWKTLGFEAGIGYAGSKSSPPEATYGGAPFSGRVKTENKNTDITARLDLTFPLLKRKTETTTTTYELDAKTAEPVKDTPSAPAPKSATPEAKAKASEPKAEKATNYWELRAGLGPSVDFRYASRDITETLLLNGAPFSTNGPRTVVDENYKPHAGANLTASLRYNHLGFYVSHSMHQGLKPTTNVGAYLKFGGKDSTSSTYAPEKSVQEKKN